MSSKYCLNSSTLSQAKEASQDHILKPDNLYRTRRGKDVVHAHGVFQSPTLLPEVTLWEQLGRAANQTWRLPWQVLAATSIS